MLSKIEVRNVAVPTNLMLTLEDPTNGYVVTNVDGLDPVPAIISTSSFAQGDGEQYHNSRRSSRNIKLTLSLKPDYTTTTIESLRKNLYKYFMPKTEIILKFYITSTIYREIIGRVETFETPIFSKDPEITISIMCFNPDFYGTNTSYDMLSTGGAIGETIVVDGTVETGFELTLFINREIPGFTMYSQQVGTPSQSMTINKTLYSGDRVVVTTYFGRKAVMLERFIPAESIIYAIAPKETWLTLKPGYNIFRLYVPGTGIPFEINFENKYGGL